MKKCSCLKTLSHIVFIMEELLGKVVDPFIFTFFFCYSKRLEIEEWINCWRMPICNLQTSVVWPVFDSNGIRPQTTMEQTISVRDGG